MRHPPKARTETDYKEIEAQRISLKVKIEQRLWDILPASAITTADERASIRLRIHMMESNRSWAEYLRRNAGTTKKRKARNEEQALRCDEYIKTDQVKLDQILNSIKQEKASWN